MAHSLKWSRHHPNQNARSKHKKFPAQIYQGLGVLPG